MITTTKTALCSICSYIADRETNPLFLFEDLVIPPAGTQKYEEELDWQREEIRTRRPGNKNWNSGKTWEIDKEEVRGVL